MLGRARTPALGDGLCALDPLGLCSPGFPGRGRPRSGDKRPDPAGSCLCLALAPQFPYAYLGGGAGGSGAASSLAPANTPVDGVKEGSSRLPQKQGQTNSPPQQACGAPVAMTSSATSPVLRGVLGWQGELQHPVFVWALVHGNGWSWGVEPGGSCCGY